jgi:hypothetical protein
MRDRTGPTGSRPFAMSLQYGLGFGVLQLLLRGQLFQRAKPSVLLDRYHDGRFAAEVDHLIRIFVGVPDRLYAHDHDSREQAAAALAMPLPKSSPPRAIARPDPRRPPWGRLVARACLS